MSYENSGTLREEHNSSVTAAGVDPVPSTAPADDMADVLRLLIKWSEPGRSIVFCRQGGLKEILTKSREALARYEQEQIKRT